MTIGSVTITNTETGETTTSELISVECSLTGRHGKCGNGNGFACSCICHWLIGQGFKDDAGNRYGTAWYRKDHVRVVFNDNQVEVYVFDTRYPGAGVLGWDAKFSSAPAAVVRGAVSAALAGS
ncbi:MAG TPA: hypothetical protein VFQ44_01800 [Streptosporangiaceae bacterium]|nr:hypothetical protein [Streptosporangiaceae bacterium]